MLPMIRNKPGWLKPQWLAQLAMPALQKSTGNSSGFYSNRYMPEHKPNRQNFRKKQ
jgi:hypothetical protein